MWLFLSAEDSAGSIQLMQQVCPMADVTISDPLTISERQPQSSSSSLPLPGAAANTHVLLARGMRGARCGDLSAATMRNATTRINDVRRKLRRRRQVVEPCSKFSQTMSDGSHAWLTRMGRPEVRAGCGLYRRRPRVATGSPATRPLATTACCSCILLLWGLPAPPLFPSLFCRHGFRRGDCETKQT